MSIGTITINAIVYTVYASRAEVNAYLNVDQVRNTAWNALTDSDEVRGPFIVAATRRLDLLTWVGEKTGGSAQENQWPRTNVPLKDGTTQSDSEVPQEVENATALLAGSINLEETTAEAGTSGSNIERVKAGSAEVEFFRPVEGGQLQDQTAFTLVKCFVEGSALSGKATGTDGESSFCDLDRFGLTEPWP